tara:strand:+ start:92 stop:439 length:348 start_codon:yes stop_codon:yes gene_type:complete
MGWFDLLKSRKGYYSSDSKKRYNYHFRKMQQFKDDYKEYWYESDRFGIQMKKVYGGEYEFHRKMAEKASKGLTTLYEPENGYEEYESEEYKNAEKTHHLAFDPFNMRNVDTKNVG